MTDIRQGGCLCGNARYEINLDGYKTSNCHCLDCRRHAGAPYVTFTIVPLEQFRWINKPQGEIKTSQTAVRRFCAICGTYLQWEGEDQSHLAEINTATIDDPSGLIPTYEIYTKSRMDGVMPVSDAKQYREGEQL